MARSRGAALDVFEYEPKVSEALLEFENVLVTPHLASATAAAREAWACHASTHGMLSSEKTARRRMP
jgi:phosphoglycerate dehydrogenase-like enzyme